MYYYTIRSILCLIITAPFLPADNDASVKTRRNIRLKVWPGWLWRSNDMKLGLGTALFLGQKMKELYNSFLFCYLYGNKKISSQFYQCI